MGYHLKEIKKGTFGEFSKIREEMEELLDAHEQKAIILQLVELSDLFGAVEAYLENYNLTLNDIIAMKDRTKSAFQSGDRK